MTDSTSKFSDPDFVRMLAMLAGKIGAEMSGPGTFGKAAGEAAVGMAQSGAMSKRMMQVGTASPTSAVPTTLALTPPLDAAKHMRSYGKLIEDAIKVDPSLMPKGYIDTITSAFSAPPPSTKDAAQDTVANAFQPVNYAPQPPTLQRTQPFSEALAMTMSPEQTAGTFQYGLSSRDMTIKEQQHAATLGMQPAEIDLKNAQARHYDMDTTYKEWEMSKEGQDAKYRLASAGVTAAAKADMEKHEYLQSAAQKYLDDNPDIRDKKPEGFPMTIGQLMKMAVENSQAGTLFSSVLNSTLDYKAYVDANKTRMTELKQARTDSEQNKTYLEITRNAEILRKMSTLRSAEDYDIKTPEGKASYDADRVMGLVRTPAMLAEMKNLHKIQEQLYKKVGLVYSPLSFLDVTKEVVTKEDLEKRAAERLKKLPNFNTEPTPTNIFNSNPFYSGGT